MSSRIMRVLVPLVAAGLFFVGIEISLRVLDLGRGHPVFGKGGLRETANYMIPDPETGGWQTQFASGNVSERKIPPKGDAKRVVLIGGSNTQSFFPHMVRQHFEQASRHFKLDQKWEIVNLGRSGYGAARARVIMREAIEKLEPDLLYIYTGDNDFVDLASFAASGVLEPGIRYDRRILGLRSVGLALELIEGNPDAGKPEPWIPTPQDRLLQLKLEDTRKHQAATRKNIDRMLFDAKKAGVPVIFSTVLYNRFAPPAPAPTPSSMSEADNKKFQRLGGEARIACPKSLLKLFFPSGKIVNASDWKSVKVKREDLPDISLEAWRRPTSPPLSKMQPYHTEPWQWGDIIWETLAGLEALHKREFTPEEIKGLEVMERKLVERLAMLEDHARTHWLLAMTQLALGRSLLSVEEHFMLAADYERAPRRANEVLNTNIRELAERHPEVHFYDADMRLSGMVEGRTLGYEWMLDHCHISIGARNLMLRQASRGAVRRWFRDE